MSSESSVNYLLKDVSHMSPKNSKQQQSTAKKSHFYLSRALTDHSFFFNLRCFYEMEQKVPVS